MDKEKLIGKSLPLIDLADYQDGSIVSRTVIDKKTGTVTFLLLVRDKGLVNIQHLLMLLFTLLMVKQKLLSLENLFI